MSYKKVYLLKVNADANNNKYYEMIQISEGQWRAEYGRVGSRPQTRTYSMSRWNAKYSEKIRRKGYIDRTKEHYTMFNSDGAQFVDDDPVVASLFRELWSYSDESINSTYEVGVGEVTQAMIDHAQVVLQRISDLAENADVKKINTELQNLYTVVPRKMKRVADHVIDTSWPSHRVTNRALSLVRSEEENIDVMSQRVSSLAEHTGEVLTLEDMGLVIAEASQEKFQEIYNLIERENRHRLKRVFVVGHKANDKAFGYRIEREQNKTVAQYWHGSPNKRWVSIIDKGLRIRPVGIPATGYDMFGKGIYFASKWQKSFGYTSHSDAYWGNESGRKGFMALFNVHVGKALKINWHDSSCYKLTYDELQRRGYYNSVHGSRGTSLLNDEYIVYNNDQVTIDCLIEVQ